MRRVQVTLSEGAITCPVSVGYRKNRLGGYDAHLRVRPGETMTVDGRCVSMQYEMLLPFSAVYAKDAVDAAVRELWRYGMSVLEYSEGGA